MIVGSFAQHPAQPHSDGCEEEEALKPWLKRPIHSELMPSVCIDMNGDVDANEIQRVHGESINNLRVNIVISKLSRINPDKRLPFWTPFAWVKAKALTLSKRPLSLLLGCLLLGLLIGLGVWGVSAAASSESNTRKANTRLVTEQKVAVQLVISLFNINSLWLLFITPQANQILSVVQSVFYPTITLATLVRQNPNWAKMNETFYSIAPSLLALPQYKHILNMQLSPFGIIRSIIPLAGFEASVNPPLNLLQRPDKRPDFLHTIDLQTLTIGGPSMLYVGILGFVGRYPVFIPNVEENETFNSPGQSYECNATTQVRCYLKETQSQFWGFTKTVIGWANLKREIGIYELCYGYNFMMTTNTPSTLAAVNAKGVPTNVTSNPFTPIASCTDDQSGTGPFGGVGKTSGSLDDLLPLNPISYTISALDNNWTLWAVDSRGWTPDWKAPLIAMVVIVSVMLTLLLLVTIASHFEQQEMIQKQSELIQEVKSSNYQLKVSTKNLEAEKDAKDLLLTRQLDLIGCLEQTVNAANMGSGKFSRPSSSATSVRQSMERDTLAQALAQIDTIRTQINMERSLSSHSDPAGPHGKITNNKDDFTLKEVLGEGSFGKVYLASWRGVEVAMKQIIFPAQMSGAEKREKMAVMEAAISSALTHPHIIQTYHYTIKPLIDTLSDELVVTGGQDAWVIGSNSSSFDGGSSMKPSGGKGLLSPNAIHFEVRLVLEYADRGCLREALDAGAFFVEGGELNLHAVLDTAIDISSAMAHLHSVNVLHSDLKARNVMLKSSTGPGRGVVAKVCDFGLSVHLDGGQTHISSVFLGTMSHMAPEALLAGRISRAADVYSFAITLYELTTGKAAFANIPKCKLGHAVTSAQRPEIPPSIPEGFRSLIERCWSQIPASRPTFVEICENLIRMRKELGGETPRLSQIVRPAKSIPILNKLEVDKFTPHEDEDVETLGQGIILSVPAKVGVSGSRMPRISSRDQMLGGSVNLPSIPENDLDSQSENIQHD